MQLDTHRLRLLAQVASCGSLSAAAQAAGYTKSAISQQMAKLEVEAGQTLLERGPRGTHLTEAGVALVAHARRIESELRQAEDELEDIAGLRRGRVRLGAFPTAAAYLLPPVIESFRVQYPGVNISVRSSRIEGLIDMLLAREIELSPMWEYDWARLPDGLFAVTPLLSDPTMLLVPADHPALDEGLRSFAVLAGESWITRGEHPVTELLMRTCHQAGFTPNVTYEAHDYQEVQAMVAVGMGVALAPRMALSGVRADVAAVDLGDMVARRRVVLAHVPADDLAPAATAIAKVFVTVAEMLQRDLEGATG